MTETREVPQEGIATHFQMIFYQITGEKMIISLCKLYTYLWTCDCPLKIQPYSYSKSTWKYLKQNAIIAGDNQMGKRVCLGLDSGTGWVVLI